MPRSGERACQCWRVVRAESSRLTGSQSVLVPVPLIGSPRGVREPTEVAALHAKILELSAEQEGREKIAPPPRIPAQRHSLPFIGPNGSLMNHLCAYCVRMVHQSFETHLWRAFII